MSSVCFSKILEVSIDAVNGRVPVIAGAIGGRTTISVAMAAEAEDMGADAVLVMSVYSMGGGSRGVDKVELVRRINDAIHLPMVLYNTPRCPVAQFPIPDLQKLAELRNVQYFNLNAPFGPFKAASDALEGKLKMIAGRPILDFNLLTLLKPVAVSGTLTTVLPEEVLEAWNYAQQGDIEKTRLTFLEKLAGWNWFLTVDGPEGYGTIEMLKEMLKQMGVIESAAPVLPKQPCLDHHKEEMTKVLQLYDKI